MTYLATWVLWVERVELHEPLGRELVRQTLHPLAAGRPHLSDLRHDKGTEQRHAAHEAERATPQVVISPVR
jgi:hypothetical protein